MLTVNELFAGIGAFRKALIRMGVPHEVIGISEIDKFAIKSYEAIYGETKNYGDISKVDKLDYADLWTYGFPCQDISLAGLQKGIVKGETRSGLLFEVQRLLIQAALDDELPKYLIMENVKNLVSKKFKQDFMAWNEQLDSMGYNNYWQVLNAKNYGIPQNRERVFMVSIRKDIDTKTFTFPDPVPLETRLKDVLEDTVDDKYYLSDSTIEKMRLHKSRNMANGNGFGWQPRTKDSIATTLLSKANRPSDNYIVEQIGNISPSNNWDNPQSGRVYSTEGLSPCLNTCMGGNLQAKIIIGDYLDSLLDS